MRAPKTKYKTLSSQSKVRLLGSGWGVLMHPLEPICIHSLSACTLPVHTPVLVIIYIKHYLYSCMIINVMYMRKYSVQSPAPPDPTTTGDPPRCTRLRRERRRRSDEMVVTPLLVRIRSSHKSIYSICCLLS